MEESHHLRFSIHLETTKMYHDMKGTYWWIRMKCDVVELCVKVSHIQIVTYAKKSRRTPASKRVVAIPRDSHMEVGIHYL